jgi:hypothetical protein
MSFTLFEECTYWVTWVIQRDLVLIISGIPVDYLVLMDGKKGLDFSL